MYNPNDFALTYHATDEVVLDDPNLVSTPHEYLQIAPESDAGKKSLLMRFAIPHIKRYDIVHSATLHLFFVSKLSLIILMICISIKEFQNLLTL